MREHTSSAQLQTLVHREGLRTGKHGAIANRCLVSLFLLIVPPGIARSQECGPLPPRQKAPYTIRVNVGLVVLHATVRNRRGILVSGLGEENFQVYEDGVLQQIDSFRHEDIPVTVGLIVDNSGSMRPKRVEVVAAALAFARSSNPEDQMFVVDFNENVAFGLPDGTPFTDDAAQLQLALSRTQPDGMTALYDAVAAGIEHLKAGDRGKKVLIVISDGADNASKHDLAEIMAMAVQSDAILYTIGLFLPEDPDHNPRVLKQLAKATGGEAFLPRSVKDVIPICERIAHDIRNQYTIAYVPTNGKQDGAYRTVAVKARRPGGGRLFVQTRSGYYALKKP
jgi:VWFA-related protein